MRPRTLNVGSDAQTTVEMVLMIAVSVMLTAIVGRSFIRPAFQKALRAWETQTGETFKTRLKQRWY